MQLATKLETAPGGRVALIKLLGVFSACILLQACGAYVTPEMWKTAEQGCKDQGGVNKVQGWIASGGSKQTNVVCNNGSELKLLP